MMESMLTPIREDGIIEGNRTAWLYQCECGTKKRIAQTLVKNGRVFSCGCVMRSQCGLSNTGAYRSWQSAKHRATNPKDKDYFRYGAVGIGMCERWLTFANFLDDMGERPAGASIDRIDKAKGYEPGNCRWATNEEQQQNRSIGYVWFIEGLKFETLREAAAHFEVTTTAIWRWVDGYTQHRDGKFMPPKTNCRKEQRYGTALA
jgi:hypothetical protein